MSKSKCSYHRKSCRFHRWQICIVKEWERPYRVQYWKATCRFRFVGSEMANKFSALEMKSYDISTATQRVLSSRKSHPIIREIIHASQVTMLELNDSLCRSQSTSPQNGSLNQKIRVHATWTTRRSTVKLTGKERVKNSFCCESTLNWVDNLFAVFRYPPSHGSVQLEICQEIIKIFFTSRQFHFHPTVRWRFVKSPKHRRAIICVKQKMESARAWAKSCF